MLKVAIVAVFIMLLTIPLVAYAESETDGGYITPIATPTCAPGKLCIHDFGDSRVNGIAPASKVVTPTPTVTPEPTDNYCKKHDWVSNGNGTCSPRDGIRRITPNPDAKNIATPYPTNQMNITVPPPPTPVPLKDPCGVHNVNNSYEDLKKALKCLRGW